MTARASRRTCSSACSSRSCGSRIRARPRPAASAWGWRSPARSSAATAATSVLHNRRGRRPGGHGDPAPGGPRAAPAKLSPPSATRRCGAQLVGGERAVLVGVAATDQLGRALLQLVDGNAAVMVAVVGAKLPCQPLAGGIQPVGLVLLRRQPPVAVAVEPGQLLLAVRIELLQRQAAVLVGIECRQQRRHRRPGSVSGLGRPGRRADHGCRDSSGREREPQWGDAHRSSSWLRPPKRWRQGQACASTVNKPLPKARRRADRPGKRSGPAPIWAPGHPRVRSPTQVRTGGLLQRSKSVGNPSLLATWTAAYPTCAHVLEESRWLIKGEHCAAGGPAAGRPGPARLQGSPKVHAP